MLDEPIDLPDGTELRIEPVHSEQQMTLAQRYKDIIGICSNLPEDMAENHDHYIYGTSKK